MFEAAFTDTASQISSANTQLLWQNWNSGQAEMAFAEVSRLCKSNADYAKKYAAQRDEWIEEAERRRIAAYKLFIVAQESRAVLFDLAARIGISEEEIKSIVEKRFNKAIEKTPYHDYYPKTTGGVLDKLQVKKSVRG